MKFKFFFCLSLIFIETKSNVFPDVGAIAKGEAAKPSPINRPYAPD